MTSIQIRVNVAWWVIPYIHVLGFFCRVAGIQIQPEKVAKFLVRHGVKTEVVD